MQHAPCSSGLQHDRPRCHLHTLLPVGYLPRGAPPTCNVNRWESGNCDEVVFSVVSGNCLAVDLGRCIQSPYFPERYVKNDACEISVLASYPVDVMAFNTERNTDILTVNGQQFSGPTIPTIPTPTAGSTITWVTDASNDYSGWKLCAVGRTRTGAFGV